MVVFPNCKINLGLNILRKREDGYHALETVFYPVPLKDALELIPSPDSTDEKTIRFTQSGLTITGDTANNLCIKAWQLLKDDFPQIGAVDCHLHKVIPMGAGLGGGSANGAFMLQLLNEIFHLALTPETLSYYALQLGSDCPFFITNKPCLASGRGEILTPLSLDLSNYRFILVYPGIHISTAEAFAGIRPANPTLPIMEIIKHPVTEWKDLLLNDFEKPLSATYPILAAIKEALYRHGAVYASLSGSGSTVYGLFEKTHTRPFTGHPEWMIFER